MESSSLNAVNLNDSFDGGFVSRGSSLIRPNRVFKKDYQSYTACGDVEYRTETEELRDLLGENISKDLIKNTVNDQNNNNNDNINDDDDEEENLHVEGYLEDFTRYLEKSFNEIGNEILVEKQNWDVLMLSGTNITTAKPLCKPGKTEFRSCSKSSELEKNVMVELNEKAADNRQYSETHDGFLTKSFDQPYCFNDGRRKNTSDKFKSEDIPLANENSLRTVMDSRGYYHSQIMEDNNRQQVNDYSSNDRRTSSDNNLVNKRTSYGNLEQNYNDQVAAMALQQQNRFRPIESNLPTHHDDEETLNTLRKGSSSSLQNSQNSTTSLSRYLRRSGGDFFSSAEELDQITETNGIYNHQQTQYMYQQQQQQQQQQGRQKNSPKLSGTELQRLSMSRSASLNSRTSSIPGSIDSGVRMSNVHNSLVVVAIDFGTTFSGYAFAFTRDPDGIHMMRKWEGGDPGVSNQKTPTTLLLKPDGTFHSFGFGARDCYHDLEPAEAKKWLYFDKFKMTLHSSEELNVSKNLKAANGKEYAAIKVFSHALRFFKDHVLAELSDQSTAKILEDDITWVLTVPAIWRQPAKQFMRNASYDAGIANPDNPERLLIALEPEAASIFCRKLRIRDCILEEDVKQKSGDDSLISEDFQGAMQYIVVDCGGGTVDLTVHELDVESGTLKELHKGTGGACGATGIDREFENLLKRIFDSEFIDRFKLKRPAGWVDLMIAFEAKKRTARPNNNSPLNISMPFSFIDYFKKHKRSTIENAVKKYKNPDIKWSSQGMLRLSPKIMKELFDPVLVKIITHIKNLLNKASLKNVEHLFLVGGFAESPLLQDRIRCAFKDIVRVVIPHDVGLTILKGAVLFGLDPTVVRIRRSALTYGVGVLNKFDVNKHDPSKRVVKDGVTWCKDIFDMFVVIDQSVGLGDSVTRSYAPARAGQKSTVINVYCSEKEHVMYTTDPEVQRCGQLRIEMPEVHDSDIPIERRGKPRELQASMIFGDTETKVRAMDMLSGKAAKAKIDFLQY